MNTFIFSLAGILVSGIFKIMEEKSAFVISANNIFYGLLMGVCGYILQWSLMESIRLEKNTNILAIISSSSILISYAYDISLMGSQFTVTSLLGSLLVFASVSFIIIFSHR